MSTENGHAGTYNAERYFVQSLRAAIDGSDLSQQAIADEMVRRGHKFYQSTIYKILNDDRKVALQEAIDLASILGMPLTEMTVPKHEATIRLHTRKAAAYEDAIRDNTSALVRRQRVIASLLASRDDWDPETRRAAETWGDPDVAERAFRTGLADANPEPGDDMHIAMEAELTRLMDRET